MATGGYTGVTLFIKFAACRLPTLICFVAGGSFACGAGGLFAGRFLSVVGKTAAGGRAALVEIAGA